MALLVATDKINYKAIALDGLFNPLRLTDMSGFPAQTHDRRFTLSFWYRQDVPASPMFVMMGALAFGGSYLLLGGGEATGTSLSRDMVLQMSGSGGDTAYGFATLEAPRDALRYCCLAVDTTQAVAANRIKMWNGSLGDMSLSTVYTSGDAINQNTDFLWADPTVGRFFIGGFDIASFVGGGGSGASPQTNVTGLIGPVHMIDGTQVSDPVGNFVEIGADGLVPRTYTGSFGACGFRLDFSDASDLGKDTSGNGWHFDVPMVDKGTLISTTGLSKFGNMTSGGGLAAAFDGNSSQNKAASASKLNTTSSDSAWAGVNMSASPKYVLYGLIRGPTDSTRPFGDASSTGISASVNLRAKSGGAPADYFDAMMQSYGDINYNPSQLWGFGLPVSVDGANYAFTMNGGSNPPYDGYERGLFGSLPGGEPIPGAQLEWLYAGGGGDGGFVSITTLTLTVQELLGLLQGKSVYVGGVEYPFDGNTWFQQSSTEVRAQWDVATPPLSGTRSIEIKAAPPLTYAWADFDTADSTPVGVYFAEISLYEPSGVLTPVITATDQRFLLF